MRLVGVTRRCGGPLSGPSAQTLGEHPAKTERDTASDDAGKTWDISRRVGIDPLSGEDPHPGDQPSVTGTPCRAQGTGAPGRPGLRGAHRRGTGTEPGMRDRKTECVPRQRPMPRWKRAPCACSPRGCRQVRLDGFRPSLGEDNPADGRSGPYALTGTSGREDSPAVRRLRETGPGVPPRAILGRRGDGAAFLRFCRSDACWFRGVPLVGSSGGRCGAAGCAERAALSVEAGRG